MRYLYPGVTVQVPPDARASSDRVGLRSDLFPCASEARGPTSGSRRCPRDRVRRRGERDRRMERPQEADREEPGRRRAPRDRCAAPPAAVRPH